MHATVEYPADPARTSGAPAVSEQAWKIMETALDATVLVDAELRIVAWNSTAEATFGWSREEALGREIVDLVPERLRGTYRLGLPAAMNPDSAIPALRTRFVTVAIRSDGEEFPIELSLGTMGSDAERLLVACARDISDRQVLSAQVAAGESHARFVANMSHELRTPLNSILGFSQLLLTDRFGSLTEKQAKYVANVESSGQHLLLLINDLLDLSKVQAGKMDITVSAVELFEVIEESAAKMTELADAKSIQLKVAGDTDLIVLADPLRLRQILLNLLSNAIKFTDSGSVRIAAIMRAQQPDRGRPVRVRVLVPPARRSAARPSLPGVRRRPGRRRRHRPTRLRGPVLSAGRPRAASERHHPRSVRHLGARRRAVPAPGSVLGPSVPRAQ